MKYLQLKFAELLSRLLPRRVAYGVARRVGDICILLDRRGRECVIGNLQRIHRHSGVNLSRRALRVLARENFLNFAKYVVDFFHFLHLSPERMNRLINFGLVPQVLDELLAKGKGIIILSAHLGNWELGASALAQRGYKFNAVALWQPDPKLNALYQSYRTRRQIHPIPFGRAARDCIAALRRNEIVALVGDRDFTASRDTVEFFGEPARLPDGPAKLALVTGAPILPTFMVRTPEDTFTYALGEPIWADKHRDDVAAIKRQIAVAMERVISDHSEQWFLFHDLWDVETDRVLATTAAFGVPPTDASAASALTSKPAHE
ncbi:MAG TPA: lysophospholipid acyltransferase family protein [Verrucomicrobiae bacterium]|nr:lysophospholipid acyltransferase family protein [Verrucomicrobiae bacterium]